jgi:hypothetical protein
MPKLIGSQMEDELICEKLLILDFFEFIYCLKLSKTNTEYITFLLSNVMCPLNPLFYRKRIQG